MNEKELLKLVAPMWKQYLRCFVGCFCAFLTFNLTSKFLVFFFMIAAVITFRSMVEVTIWQRKICKGDYELVTCRVGGKVLAFTMVYYDIADKGYLVHDDTRIASHFMLSQS